MLSKSIVRSPSWYNLLAAWLVYSLSYGLLVGRQEGPGQPPIGLCLAQTLLIYAVPPLVTSATLNLYIDLYLILREVRSGVFNGSKQRRSFWLVIVPWLIFVVIIIELLLLIFPGHRFHLVERTPTNFYCHLGDTLPSIITGGVVVAITSTMLPLQVWLAVTIYRSSDALRRLAEADRHLFITLYVRLTLTTLVVALGFGLSISAIFLVTSDEISLVYPIVAVAIGVALGTQKVINLLMSKHHMVEGNLSVGHPPRLVILAPI
ncbi:hypothetical protein Agabi119p4_11606 [Agaricus bisporus var. burnettii]|uniref:Uncharacterized protein n=1 Tax=Agaricus bisporus var. burnettii TaxID=192524 RepID=A0A8H7EV48_AGABI|nr:hypothetical protein Agabi119p4_11606 [Agaricus bisporus var. burnettii]